MSHALNTALEIHRKAHKARIHNHPGRTFNPSYNSSLNANLSQPFLRNFRIDANRLQLKVAKKNREISDVLGISLGGTVSQQVALAAPKLCRSRPALA